MLGLGNHKIKLTGEVYGLKSATFDLLAGHTCPMANLCHSQVEIKNGKREIKDFGEFRCYATKNNLPTCYVITDLEDWYKNHYNLPIACQKDNYVDDFEYIMIQQSFGIILH